MRKTSRQSFRPALAAACSAAALLSACATAPTEPAAPPPPVETEAVRAVKALVLPIDDTITVADAFAQYGACKPGTQVWEQIDGDVQFSCTFDDGTIVQFDFRQADDGRWGIGMVTYTTMNDAEFAGISVRGPDAEDMLRRVYFNKKLF